MEIVILTCSINTCTIYLYVKYGNEISINNEDHLMVTLRIVDIISSCITVKPPVYIDVIAI